MTGVTQSEPAGAGRPRRIRRRARQQVVQLRVSNLLSLRIALDQDVRLPQGIPGRAMLVQQASEAVVAGLSGQSEIIGCGTAPPGARGGDELGKHIDRKSTRLNSSHLVISYAVFCLKK